MAMAAVSALLVTVAQAVDHPDQFRAWSPDFDDNGMLSADNASMGTSPRGPWQCGGKNLSPALSWSGAPANTLSFAVLMDDPDAASGRGGNHWITYDIPATAKGIAKGDADKPGKFVSGDSGRFNLAYHGACAEPGAKAHHFIFFVYALDIPLGQLKPGLTKAAFMPLIQGHNAAEASIVARYQRSADGNAMATAK
jgi:Raf kinase inhibitor-like YbhB/YbcL family protein